MIGGLYSAMQQATRRKRRPEPRGSVRGPIQDAGQMRQERGIGQFRQGYSGGGLRAFGGFRDNAKVGRPNTFSGISHPSDISRSFGPNHPSDQSRQGFFDREGELGQMPDPRRIEELRRQRAMQGQRSAPRWPY